MQFSPHVAVLTRESFDDTDPQGSVSAPRSAPWSVKHLPHYALKGASAPFNLAHVRERVIIADSVEAATALGMIGLTMSGSGTCGVYQDLPSGQLGVLLPWDDKVKRQIRSYTWRQYFTHAVAQARQVAATGRPWSGWGNVLTGEGPAVLRALERLLASPEPVAVDVETAGDMPDICITAIGIAGRDVSVSVPWEAYNSKVFGLQTGLGNDRIRAAVKAILASPAHAKVFHNGGFDRAVFAARGMPCLGEYEDTILQMKDLYPELYRNLQFAAGLAGRFPPWKDAFKNIRKALLKQKADAVKALRKERGKKYKIMNDWAEIPLDALLTYNGQDAAATIVLWYYLRDKQATHGRGTERYDMLRQLADIAADQWLTGVAIDLQARNAMLDDTARDLEALALKWMALVGPDVPLSGKGSGDAQKKWFFETHKAPIHARSPETKKPSMNTYTLAMWYESPRQPVSDAAWILYRIRKLRKARDAFLTPTKTEVVYAQPNVVGTVGTRESYSKPNLQQWAKAAKTTRLLTGESVALAPNIRKLVIPHNPAEQDLIEADYKALEVRGNAYRTNNMKWFEWMDKGIDMHVMHVGLMFDQWLHRKGCGAHGCDGGKHYCLSTDEAQDWIDPDSIRQIAKVVTFARNYNEKGNPAPVVKALQPKMPTLDETKVNGVFAAFDIAIPNIAAWHQEIKHRGAAYAETGIGGWRLPADPKRPDVNREGSFEIQSTVGHVVSTAKIAIVRRLRADKALWSRGARVLFCVHDSVVAQAPKDPGAKREVGLIIKTEMEWTIPELWGHKAVSFPVEMKTGPSWAAMKPFHV